MKFQRSSGRRFSSGVAKRDQPRAAGVDEVVEVGERWSDSGRVRRVTRSQRPGGAAGGDEHEPGEGVGVVGVEGGEGEVGVEVLEEADDGETEGGLEGERDGGGGGHGGDFRPGIDAPPEPAKHEDEAGPGAESEEELPGGGDGCSVGLHVGGGAGGKEGDEDGGEAGGVDVVALGRVLDEETLVEIVDEVGGAEVEMGADGGHIGCGKAGEHEASEAGGEVVDHDPDVCAFVSALGGAGVGEEDEGDEGGGDPRPGAEGVMGDVEPEGCADAVFFVFWLRRCAGRCILRRRVRLRDTNWPTS